MEKNHLIVQVEFDTERIDRYLAKQLDGFARNSIQHLCDKGFVTSSGKALAKNYRIHIGEVIEVMIPPAKELEVAPQNIPLDIVYEDADLLVVNKPKGLVVHPAPGNEDGTLVNALLYHCRERLSGINGVIRPGIVHRIDKDTSGLLAVAKNDRAHRALSEQIQTHSFTRRYETVVYGRVQANGTVDAPIARHPTDRKRMCSMAGGRHAVTHYEVIAPLEGFTHLSVRLETGRTHQIRVHMALLGHPVAGDPVYGPKKIISSLEGQCLHAKTLGFVHPVSGKYLEFTSELPGYFTRHLKLHAIKE